MITSILYTHDYISSTGGTKSGPRNIGAFDLYLSSDLSKYSQVRGDFMAHYVHINQNDTRAAIGDIQTASNIDAPMQVDRMGDLWYQHHISKHLKILFGLHDISSEFNITPSSLTFLNSSFGTSAELSYSGLNSPSIYPITSLGGRVLFHFNDSLTLRSGIYHANPGGTETYRSFHVDVNDEDGFMYISELAYQTDERKFGLGGWNYTRDQNRIGSIKTAPLFGFYSMMEESLSHSLWTFLRVGWASPISNEIESNIATGFVYRGIFQKKTSHDEIGIGLTTAHFSRGYKHELAMENQENKRASNETTYEFYYQFKPAKQISLRPDIQFISSPGGIQRYRNAWAMGLRTIVEI